MHKPLTIRSFSLLGSMSTLHLIIELRNKIMSFGMIIRFIFVTVRKANDIRCTQQHEVSCITEKLIFIECIYRFRKHTDMAFCKRLYVLLNYLNYLYLSQHSFMTPATMALEGFSALRYASTAESCLNKCRGFSILKPLIKC